MEILYLQFACLLTFICNSQSNTHVAFTVIRGHTEWEKIESPGVPILAEVKEGNT